MISLKKTLTTLLVICYLFICIKSQANYIFDDTFGNQTYQDSQSSVFSSIGYSPYDGTNNYQSNSFSSSTSSTNSGINGNNSNQTGYIFDPTTNYTQANNSASLYYLTGSNVPTIQQGSSAQASSVGGSSSSSGLGSSSTSSGSSSSSSSGSSGSSSTSSSSASAVTTVSISIAPSPATSPPTQSFSTPLPPPTPTSFPPQLPSFSPSSPSSPIPPSSVYLPPSSPPMPISSPTFSSTPTQNLQFTTVQPSSIVPAFIIGNFIIKIIGSNLPAVLGSFSQNSISFQGCNTIYMNYNALSNGGFQVSNYISQTNKICTINYDNEYIQAWQQGTNFQPILNGYYITQGVKQILQLQGPILQSKIKKNKNHKKSNKKKNNNQYSFVQNVPQGNFMLSILGSNLPSINALVGSKGLQFRGCNNIAITSLSTNQGYFKPGNIIRNGRNQCVNNNDQKYLQALMGGDSFLQQGNNFYLMSKGRKIAEFVYTGVNQLAPINTNNGGIYYRNNMRNPHESMQNRIEQREQKYPYQRNNNNHYDGRNHNSNTNHNGGAFMTNSFAHSQAGGAYIPSMQPSPLPMPINALPMPINSLPVSTSPVPISTTPFPMPTTPLPMPTNPLPMSTPLLPIATPPLPMQAPPFPMQTPPLPMQAPPSPIPSFSQQSTSFAQSSAFSSSTASSSFSLTNGKYITSLLGSNIPTATFTINNNQIIFQGCNTYQITFNTTNNGYFKVLNSNNLTNINCNNNYDNQMISALTNVDNFKNNNGGQLYFVKGGKQIIKCQLTLY